MLPSNPDIPEPTGRKAAAGYTKPSRAAGVRFASLPAYHGETYYGRPPIKHSHYKWRTAVAFFCNGLAGGAQIIATQADLFGGGQTSPVIRTGRYLALAGGAMSTVTLISSLHTRRRWYNMLRIFKRTSPMSIGIWAITPFTLLSGLTATGQLLADAGLHRSGRWMARGFGLPAAALGALVMTYMGTELEETNTPLWASAHPAMAPLYAAGGMSNASAALLLGTGPSGTPDAVERGLKRLALVSAAAEMTLGTFLNVGWSCRPETQGFFKSSYGAWFRVMESGWMASLVLRLLDGADRSRRPHTAVVSSLVKLADGLLAQLVMIYAGRESGRHARDYFEYTRTPDTGDGLRRTVLPEADVASAIPMVRATSADAVRPTRRRVDLSTVVALGIFALGTAMLLPSIKKSRKGSS